MKIIFFTFYYPPDLSAGSFRAVALAKALSSKMKVGDEIHVITTHPNRYASHRLAADDLEVDGKLTIHRIALPWHQSGIMSQVRTFSVYSVLSYRLCSKIKPDFLIGTTSRLMTGLLTGAYANRFSVPYFIDLRDIFSETISDLFSQKNWLLGMIAKKIFSFLDRHLLSNAVGVNVVSEEFNEYFQSKEVVTSDWSFFPNGVDEEFIGLPTEIETLPKSCRTILYAGNIGSGQGLETVVPPLAKQLSNDFQFVIVGDGGRLKHLVKEIQKEEIGNIKIALPVSRIELLDYYRKADILFLHLNDVPAFRRVLPSKIFEYAAIGKPIVAGLSGYPAKFLREKVPYANLFAPGDFDGAYEAVIKASETKLSREVVRQFVSSYSREFIMDKMTDHLMRLIMSNIKVS